MSGGQLDNSNGSVTRNHIAKRIMNNQSSTLADHNSSPIAASSMPVSAATPSFNQVLRMPALQEFHHLASLNLSPYGNVDHTAHGSYFYHDNGYEMPLPTLPGVKEEKSDETITKRSVSPASRKSPKEETRSRLNKNSIKPSTGGYHEMNDVSDIKPRIKIESGVAESSVSASGGMSGHSYHSHSLPPSEKIINNANANLMMVRSPHNMNNHQTILRYPPNGGDTLLSANALGYNDSEMISENHFNVNNPLGSLLGISASGSGGDSSSFDLFDGEGRQDNFNQDLQLSPSTFSNSAETYGLNENSNHDPIIDESAGKDTSKSSEDENKLNITNSNAVLNKQKNKCKQVKSGSPNRTGTLPCPVCSKVFSNSSALAKHKLTHSDERKYVCQLCAKAFKRQDHLNGHLLTHMNKKPYECKVEGCGKSYCDARSLRRHTENHHAAMAQASVTAAAAAVNAISIRMGSSNVENDTNNNSFLAAALQSNRIRYAPPPSTSSSTGVAARSSPTLVSGAYPNDESGSITSAATQLQILAYQQSAAANQDSSSTASTAASTWHQQQNVLFINSSLGRIPYGGIVDKQSSSVIKDDKVRTNLSSSGPNEGGSVLERHLKMGITSSKEVQGAENASSTTSNEILSQAQPSILQSLHSLPSSTQNLPLMAFQLKNQWPQTTFSSSLDFGSEPKPVECNICQRRFKNIPALNGHMRLHGGYLKRDAEILKKIPDKKSDIIPSFSTSSSSHSPLQTASINVRALIEEKIIQKRIVNPTLPSLNSTSIPPPPLFLPIPASISSVINNLPSTTSTLPPPTHPPPIDTHSSMEHHQPMSSNYINISEMIDSESVDDGLLYENSDHQPELPPPNLPPPPPPPPPSQSSRKILMQDNNSMIEDAQTSMQRQIEIIKQGLMSHQPVLEKFRRHSDSDHFLAPDRSSFVEFYDPTSPSFMDYMRQRISGKRTQRTGSDPGEFMVGPDQLNDDMFGGDLDIGDLNTGDDDVTGAIQSSDMMDFEMVDATTDQSSKNASSLLSAALCSTPPTSLLDVIEGMPSPFNDHLVIPESNKATASENSFKNVDLTEDDDVFLSPSSIPSSPSIIKRKHRPEPLHIPPQVSTCGYQSRLRSPRLWDPMLVGKVMSPPPYTPPPMLSPVRSGPGLFWHVLGGSGSITPKSAPITPGRFSNTVEITPPTITELEDPIESYNEPPETDIQPHVNIGPNYQARLPQLRTEQKNYDPYMADLVYDPKTEELLNERDLEMYQQFACCAAIPGGGRNKEYALHILHMAKGDIQEAMLKLMEPVPKLPKTHPLFTYSYPETDKWDVEEIESYQQALNDCDKDFLSIAQEVKTKNVQQCVQFYYLWKKICPEEYKRLRIVRRKREMDRNYNLRSKSCSPDQSNTPKSEDRGSSPGQQADIGERYVCDHPDCFAIFSTKQALNGHIRIHGGNLPLGRLGPNGKGTSDDLSAQPYSPSTNSVSNASTHYAETIEEFPCRVCGKVFYKIKSRNAHMKSHRPLDSNK